MLMEQETSLPLSSVEALNALIDEALQVREKKQSPRTYLGASSLGRSCGREIQYGYLNIPKDKPFTGQTLRTFEIGHTLEALAREWLRKAEFEIITHEDGQPLGFSTADGKIQGHVDGIIHKAPASLNMAVPALWECKTMNERSWKETVAKGLKASKPDYAVQIALYQGYMEESVPRVSEHPALFTAINKNTSALYHEWVPYDRALAQEASDRAVNILKDTKSGHLFPRGSSTSEGFICRFCAWATTCWKEVG
ncbi:hypothetical protein Cva_01652 [Caedimonas varicaedens]|uniref:PD-(D/E)XK nuclease superfamily protein n=1 Tax=Caedimonas varicaedens TaxID=1629334 RepID=A0A0K8MEV3_9PROT|nr:hypothetical protein Cva_01652 [Caedimonas varicaedens]